MSRMNRREFLSESFFAAALASTASLSLPVARNPLLAAESGPAANETLGVMVMGCGGRGVGSHVMQFLKDKRTSILYLCDPDLARAESAADKVEEAQGSRPKTIRDMREALGDKNLDVVSCASANHWHALCGVWAMQAGKHVYIEKPICHNLHEGKALVAAAKKYNRCCQVGSQCRSNPAVVQATEFVRSGGIGDVKITRGLCYKRRKAIGPLGEYPVPAGVDYNLWTGPAPMAPVTRPQFHYDWHWQRLYGNGDSGNQGPHQTDIARVFLGVTTFPENVISYGGRLGYDVEKKDASYVDAGDTANTQVSIYNYADGKTLVFETRGLETEAYKTGMIGVIAYGTDGYVVQDNYGLCVVFDPDGSEVKRFEGGSDDYHFNNFVDCVLAGTPEKLNADARCGYLSAGLSHLGNISYYLGEKNKVSPDDAKKLLADYPGQDNNLDTLQRTLDHLTKNGVDLARTPISIGPVLKFDSTAEHFIDNAEAGAMESREYRGDFVVPAAENV